MRQLRRTTRNLSIPLAAGLLVLAACGADTTDSADAADEPAGTADAADPGATDAETDTGSGGEETGEASGSPTDAKEIEAVVGITDDTSWCGTEPMTLAIHDAFGTNGWSQASMAAVRSEAARCENVEQVVAIGNGDLQKAISDVNAFTAQGVDALVLIPSLGPPQLPAIQQASGAGVEVVAWAASPGGEPGTDYAAYVDWDTVDAGRVWGQWMVDTLGGEGKVAFLGGPAGNPVTVGTLSGVVEVFAENPGMELVTGDTDWAVTNWDPAQAQQAMAALLSSEPEIDGLIVDDGQSALGAMRAYASAGQDLVPIASLEANSLACEYLEVEADNPDFELATMSARNWLGRIAVRKAVAAVQGTEAGEPDLYQLGLFEDTTAGLEPTCDESFGPDAFLSNQLSVEDLETYGTTE